MLSPPVRGRSRFVFAPHFRFDLRLLPHWGAHLYSRALRAARQAASPRRRLTLGIVGVEADELGPAAEVCAPAEFPDVAAEGLALPVDDPPATDGGGKGGEVSSAGRVELEGELPDGEEEVLLEVLAVFSGAVKAGAADNPGGQSLGVDVMQDEARHLAPVLL